MRIDAATTDPLSPPEAPEETGKQPKEEFLNLLVAQLQNQDPLEPQSGAEFVAQLAQFASIEMGLETNQRLAAIEAGQASLTSASMTQMVGKDVTTRVDSFRLSQGGTVPPIRLDLDGDVKSVQVVVRDEAGNEIKTISMGAATSGEHALAWDGTANGAPLKPGAYSIEITATAADGSAVDAHAITSGRVDALEFSDGETLFSMGGLQFLPADILSVKTTEPSTSSTSQEG